MKPLRRLIVIPVALTVAAAVPPALKLAPQYATAPDKTRPPGPPSGATGRCNDGLWAFGPDVTGSCAGHGGVRFETELGRAGRRDVQRARSIAQRSRIEFAAAVLIAIASCMPFLIRRGTRAGATGVARWSLVGLLAIAFPTLLVTGLALPFSVFAFIFNDAGLSLPALVLRLAPVLLPAAWAALVVGTAMLALRRFDTLRIAVVFGSAAALTVFLITFPDAALMFRAVGRLLGF